METYAKALHYDWSKLDENLATVDAIFNKLKNSGIKVSSTVLNSYLEAYSRGTKIELCEEKFKLFDEYNIKRQHNTYVLMIKMFCTGTRNVKEYFPKAFEYLEKMKQEGIKPKPIIYEILIVGCAHALKLFEGVKLLQQMIDLGYQPRYEKLRLFMHTVQGRYPEYANDIMKLCGWWKPPGTYIPRRGLLDDMSEGVDGNINSRSKINAL